MNAFCARCGQCLYGHASQKDEAGKFISDEFPIVRCTRVVDGKVCNTRNFWD